MSSLDDGSFAHLANIPFGFTTTPDQRIGPGPPYTNPSLQVNLFFRVFLGIIAILVSWVPARLLWRNGEFGAAIFCGTIVIRCIGYIINALIWRDDNVAEWYAGYGWCDLQVYLNFAIDTAFNTCVFEVMRSMYFKVGLDRVSSLTNAEHIREQLISAVVIFTIPIIQVILTFFLMVRRYNISTLVGCTALYHLDWLFFVFYIIPTPVFVTLAAILAVLVFIRFRRIEMATRGIVHSHDSVMSARQHRVRRKLYFMVLCVLVIVVPLCYALLVVNTMDGWSFWSDPYDYDLIHHGPDPFNTYFISFTTSDMVRFVDMNINYIPTLTAIAVFLVFGTTTEGINDYRCIFLLCGLGYIFPKLRQEYNPDTRRSGRAWFYSLSRIFPASRSRSTRTTRQDSNFKGSQCGTVGHISHTTTTIHSCDHENGTVSCCEEEQNLWPDLSDQAISEPSSAHTKNPNRNPWLFRTPLPGTPFRVPAVSFPPADEKPEPTEKSPRETSRVCSAPPQPSKTNTTAPKTGLEEGDAPRSGKTRDDAQVWIGNSAGIARVDTRVWASQSGRESFDREGDEDSKREHLGVMVQTEMRVASTREEAIAASVAARIQADPAAAGRS